MIYKQWDIDVDGYSAPFSAIHERYDPTPSHPFDPFGDPDNVLYGDTPEALMQMIDEMEIEQ